MLILYGGEQFYVEAAKITGWKPLGRKFHVTKSDGRILQELDGIPAYEVYQKYLKIQNDENFFYHTLEFPMFYEHNGTTILRVPAASNPDNSITMSSDIDVDSIVRISYGNPETIIDSIKTAAMREGSKNTAYTKSSVQAKSLTHIPLASRLANFISATSLELEEMNQQLASINKQLKKTSITDGLTGLYNRKEIQSHIGGGLHCMRGGIFSIIMLDIDNFKQVNDIYGHQEGDNVIIALAKILQDNNILDAGAFSAGRWGGEEFMLLLPDCGIDCAKNIAERIRKCFAGTTFQQAQSLTVSIGFSQARENDTLDFLCVRVDEALYAAKQSGKNKVVVC